MLLWMMIDTHTFVFVSSLVFDICLYFTANGNPALVWLGLEWTRDCPSSRAFFFPILFSSLLPLRFFLFLLSSSTRTSSRILNKLSSPFGHSVNQYHSLLFLLLFRVCLIDLQLLQRSLSGTWLCDCKSPIFYFAILFSFPVDVWHWHCSGGPAYVHSP